MARPRPEAGTWQGQPLPRFTGTSFPQLQLRHWAAERQKAQVSTGCGGKKKIPQALSFSNKMRRKEEERAYSMFPIPGTGKVPVCRRM